MLSFSVQHIPVRLGVDIGPDRLSGLTRVFIRDAVAESRASLALLSPVLFAEIITVCSGQVQCYPVRPNAPTALRLFPGLHDHPVIGNYIIGFYI